MELSTNEIKVLLFLRDANKEVAENEIKIETMSDREISSAISWLEVKGLTKVDKSTISQYSLGKEGNRYLSEGLPEEIAYSILRKEGKIPLGELFRRIGDKEGKIAVVQLSKLGIKPIGGVLNYSEIKNFEKIIGERKRFLEMVSSGVSVADDAELIGHFKKREGIIAEKKVTERHVAITSIGLEYLSTYDTTAKIDSLTSEIITSQEWKTKSFRRYDLNVPVERIYGASFHPLTYLINKIRRVFLEMGFSEMHGHYVEYAGWNMDALFIPQEHPARDLQDTFYLESDTEIEFEHPEIIDIVKKSHERGIPGYSGWGYEWGKERAMELLLRTHTTVNTIRYLYEHNEPPVAIFSVEKVFRHESVDWKHLAELFQIEGAVYSKDANISSLKWLMRKFYERLGFKDIKFIPSYYPYTEPSMDAVAYIDGREIELGGSGVFRPEVTKPLGLKQSVIAWGLGLERLAMMYYGLSDIRDIYESDIDWLRNYRIRF